MKVFEHIQQMNLVIINYVYYFALYVHPVTNVGMFQVRRSINDCVSNFLFFFHLPFIEKP